MNTYTRYTKTEYVNDFNIDLSYVKLMTDLNEFIDNPTSSEEINKNAEILNTQCYDVVVYSRVSIRESGMTKTFEIDSNNYNTLTINGLNMLESITYNESLAFYATKELNIRHTGTYSFQKDDYLDVYVSVKTPENIYKTVFYHFCLSATVSVFDDLDYKPDNIWFISVDKDTNHTISVKSSNPDWNDFIYLNSCSFTNIIKQQENEIYSIADANIFKIYVDPVCNIILDIAVTIDNKTYNYTYYPNIVTGEGYNARTAQQMNRPDMSYALLRANPKLSGNIKVVVDSKENVYIDVFKISDILSNDRYRKNKIDVNEYYGEHIMSIFDELPTEELYRIDDNCYNLFSPAKSFDKQHYDVYNYGVRTNSDKLYPENFSLLAPLRVKKILPDFFLIFRADDVICSENISDAEKFQRIISEGTLIKSFDLRNNSNIGKYLYTFSHRAKDANGYGFISYDERSFNTFTGISIERGVISTMYESNVNLKEITSQVQLNKHLSEGFSRNNIVASDIINLEFMFDDNDADLFSINSYFGIYIKLNTPGNDVHCIGKTSDINGNVSYIFDKEIKTFPIGDLPSTDYIYGLVTPDKFIRSSIGMYNNKEIEPYVLKPFKAVATANLRKIDTTNIASICKIKFNDKFVAGEHLRIIDKSEKSKYTFFEIIFSNNNNVEEYLKDDISEEIINFTKNAGISYLFHRISVYVAENESLDVTVNKIAKAFNNFTDKPYTLSYDGDTLYFIGYKTELTFEKIYVGIGDTTNEFVEKNDLIAFDNIITDTVFLNLYSLWKTSQFAFLYPFDFTIFGNRYAKAVDFINTNILGPNNTLYAGEIIYLNNVISDETTIFKGIDNSYNILNSAAFNTYSNNAKNIKNIQNIKSFLNWGTILPLQTEPYMQNDVMSIYNLVPLNNAICSIFDIKDFYYEVLDNTDMITCVKEFNKISNGGEFLEKNAFSILSGQSPICVNQEEYLSHYISVTKSPAALNTAQDINKYFYDKIYNASTGGTISKSDISLICSNVCKWRACGTDARGNNLRIMDNYNNIDSFVNSYFVVNSDAFNNDLGYIQYNNTEYPKFIEYSLNSPIESKSVSLRDAILYGNVSINCLLGNTSDNKWATAFKYGSNAIEFISAGIKFKISCENKAMVNISKYNNYSAIFVCLAGPNIYDYSCELIIDETDELILLAWYQSNLSSKDDSIAIDATCKISNMYCVSSDNITKLYIPIAGDFSNYIGKDIVLSSEIHNNINSYTRQNAVVITGTIEEWRENENKIVLVNSKLWINNNAPVDINYENLNAAANKYGNQLNGFILATNEVMNKSTYADLKSDISSCKVLIKTANGVNDYTSAPVPVKSTIVEPIEWKEGDNTYCVHPSYIEPVLNSMLIFDNKPNVTLKNIFGMTFDNANIIIKNVNTIPQYWYNKYTENDSFCSYIDPESKTPYAKTSLGIQLNKSIMQNPWSNSVFFKSDIDVDLLYETTTTIKGYIAAYENETFLGSRGIVLQNNMYNKVSIQNWYNSIKTDEYIRLCIDDSIIQFIMFSKGFYDSWTQIESNTNDYKVKYIENVILPHFVINNTTKFVIYHKPSAVQTIMFNSKFVDSEEYIISDCKNELRFENNKYYMYLYPSEYGTYAAKMIFDL